MIKSKIKILKNEIGKIFNKMLVGCYVMPIMENIETLNNTSKNPKVQKLVDQFFLLCFDALEDSRFVCYYEEKFNFSEHIEMICQISKM